MSTVLERLKLSVKKDIIPDDIIMGILAGLQEDLIPKDPAVFHRTIYELRKKEEFREMLEEFYFDTSGITPFSELLDSVLFRLETAGTLATYNPRYEKYQVKRDKVKARLEKFSDPQKALLAQMSQEFQALISG
ncbi:MAG TPA: hypothetical protein GX504_02110 [Clostridia bacterium]|nr:hypothetical protein [Clostridia bacterium]